MEQILRTADVLALPSTIYGSNIMHWSLCEMGMAVSGGKKVLVQVDQPIRGHVVHDRLADILGTRWEPCELQKTYINIMLK